MAFLQAMVDASTLADAGVGASDASAPTQDGALTAAAGTSPARAVVLPWNEVFSARKAALHGNTRTAAEPDADTNAQTAAASVPLAAVSISTLEPVSGTASQTTRTANDLESPNATTAPDLDDEDSAAMAFLLAVATLPQGVPLPPADKAPVVDTPSSSADPSALASPASAAATLAAVVVVDTPPSVAPPAATASAASNRQTPRLSGQSFTTDATGSIDAELNSLADSPMPESDSESATGDRVQLAASETPTVSQTDTLKPPAMHQINQEIEVASESRKAAASRVLRRDPSRTPPIAPIAGFSQPGAKASSISSVATSQPVGAETPLLAIRAEAAALFENGKASDIDLRQRMSAPVPSAANPESRAHATDWRELSASRLQALREHVASTAAVGRLFDSAVAQPATGLQREAHDVVPHADRRHAAVSPASDLIASALSLTSRVEVDQPAAAAEVAETAPASRTLPNEAANAQSIVRSMQWQYRNGVGTAVVQLDPGYLGDVRVALRVDGQTVTATLHAASAEVRAWMQANESSLRQSLSAQGLSLDTLVIADEHALDHRTSPDDRRKSEQDDTERRRRPRRTSNTDDEGRTFEIVV